MEQERAKKLLKKGEKIGAQQKTGGEPVEIKEAS